MISQHRRALIALIALLTLISATAIPAGANPPAQISSQPHILTGTHAISNPIYSSIGAEGGALLYDFSGFVLRDYDYYPPEDSQVLGTIEGDITGGTYRIELPETPNGAWLDFDGNPNSPPGVQIFVTATYINFLGDEYLERGEPPLNMSADMEPMTFNVVGGHLVVWAETDGDVIPSGRGPDGVLFTEDDPTMPLQGGWNVVALDSEPFKVYRNETVEFPIIESIGALNDYSDLDYQDAWDALFERTQTTYPFTEDKNLDWDAIYDYVTPLVQAAESDIEFHLAIIAFGEAIPDTHIGYASPPVTTAFLVGGVGIRSIAITDNGDLVIVDMVNNGPADQAGVEPGDVLVAVDETPALAFLDDTPLLLTSASTRHGRRYFQAATMLQGPIDSAVSLTWRSPDGTEQTAPLTRVFDISPLLALFESPLTGGRVIQAEMLESGVGYIGVRGFAEDVSAADALFASQMDALIAEGAQGIILDVRHNTGGLVNLAMAMAGRFFPDYERLFDFYYADGEGGFAYRGFIEILAQKPYYDGPVAVLVDEMTGSAGEMFAYAMHTEDRAIVVGHTPTGGFTGEVSDGQYVLPGSLSIQIPTGRPVHPETGDTVIEGTGVVPDILVPLTAESLLSPEDEVLQAAVDALLAQ
jgi:carboxyl-terminal processing protease